ncbi:General transcription factor II-I repeat domain-containing protein 2 [Merluccius polli]|uniref:General transcription factor II-I repeat domain-containing protein 2 n=1 Tax=Merluccius polli TaxID=89951 RepID=A0AA47NYW9_MERPO|nr:General transcription factor II-I repeat domain-containing protein 2 [Merluccius polli]
MDVGTPFSGEKYADAIVKLQEEFDHRFADFKAHRATFQMFADPFSFDVQDASHVLKMELIDLHCNSELKAKFREGSVAPARGEEGKEWVCRVCGVFEDVPCPLPGPSSVQVLEGGQGGTSDFSCSVDYVL